MNFMIKLCLLYICNNFHTFSPIVSVGRVSDTYWPALYHTVSVEGFNNIGWRDTPTSEKMADHGDANIRIHWVGQNIALHQRF